MRTLFLLGGGAAGLALGTACACPTPPSIAAEDIRSGPGRDLSCDVVQAFSHVDYVVITPDLETLEREELEGFVWTLPDGAAINGSNDDGSVLGILYGDEGGGLCTTATMQCEGGTNPESNTACVDIRVVTEGVHTPLAQASAAPPHPRDDAIGAVIDGVGYTGMGVYSGAQVPGLPGRHANDWWSFDPEALSWTELEPLPSGGGPWFASYVLEGAIHVVGPTEHHAYTPGGGWAQVSTPALPLLPAYAFVDDGVAWVGGEGDGSMLRFDASAGMWEVVPDDAPQAGWTVTLDGQVHLITPDGSVLRWDDGWAGISAPSSCAAFPSLGATLIGEAAYAFGGGHACVFDGAAWQAVPRPTEGCGQGSLAATRGGYVMGFDDRALYNATSADGHAADAMMVFLAE